MRLKSGIFASKEGGRAHTAMEHIRQAGPMTSRQLSPVMGLPPKRVHSYLTPALDFGALVLAHDDTGATVFSLNAEHEARIEAMVLARDATEFARLMDPHVRPPRDIFELARRIGEMVAA